MNEGKSRRERGPDPFVPVEVDQAGASGKVYDSSMLVEIEEGHECWTAHADRPMLSGARTGEHGDVSR